MSQVADTVADRSDGLTTRQVRERLAADGPNVLPAADRPHPVRELARQLTHLLALLLWLAAGLALLGGMPELAAAIVVIVVLNGVFAYWQERRADRSVEQLRTMLPSTVRVVRNGRPCRVDASELVRGDLVLIAAGDRIAADMRVLDARGLTLDESIVTGESMAVPRGPGGTLQCGTFVAQGEATALVVATGAKTSLASVSVLAATAERPPSPLTRELSRVVRVVATIAIGAGLSLGVVAFTLGLRGTDAFLLGVGVAVALVPEGLLPTVTLSLARGAQYMAARNALVRRLDAVETLGATTFICTDKTGTLTENRMAVTDVVTPAGAGTVLGHGYQPVGQLVSEADLHESAARAARAAVECVTGRVVRRGSEWVSDGDPMEAALHCFALRMGVPDQAETAGVRRPYSAERMLSSSLRDGEVSVLGAPEAVLARCRDVDPVIAQRLASLTDQGRRVLAVARRRWNDAASEAMEHDLGLLALLGLEDPPRSDVSGALQQCRDAGIRVAMVTGDHPGTAAAIAREIGLLDESGTVLVGGALPEDDVELAARLDNPGGAVVARVTPADKFRIARVLRERGHVVAMTGDGVNDAPALREADVGVAMGATGSDSAREAADLVLLDDRFSTIITAIELGRATFRNVRRFLTYHLTDNVAELTPFVLWAATGGSFPLAIGVLQVLALDVGTDMLPALALGAEPSRPGIMRGRHLKSVVDRALLLRSFTVLGATEALASMTAFALVLMHGGWRWGTTPDAALLGIASGTAFAAIALSQMANAFACRSTSLPVWRMPLLGNRLLIGAVLAEVGLVLAFLGIPQMSDLLGGSWPSPRGWLLAGAAAVLLVLVDGVVKSRVGHPDPRRVPNSAP
jgi:magnesium-transporting ATPase (P-type)